MNKPPNISGHFEGTQGVNLYFQGWIPQYPRALVILIHGAGEHSGRYSHLGEACMHNEVALIAPDLRGFGQSEGPRGHINCFREYLDDLDKLIQFFQADYQSIPIFLSGHSLGGLIVIRYVQTYPVQVKGVILSSPALGLRFRMPYSLKKIVGLISWLYPGLSIEPFQWSNTLRKLRMFKSLIPNKPPDMLKDPLSTLQYTPRWLTELLINGIHSFSEVASFRLPTLCFCGQKDPLIEPGLIQHFINSITIQDKKYVMFPEGHHRPFHEPHSHQTIDNMLTWINDRLETT